MSLDHRMVRRSPIGIAVRPGLTNRTFFRHLADKREVLLLGEDVLSRPMADAIADAPESAMPVAAIAAALNARSGVPVGAT